MLTEELEYRVINRNMPSYTAADQPLIKAVQKGVRQVFGYRPEATYMAATTDAHHFREILGIPTAAFGPGYVELAHAYDEFVYVEDIEKAAKSYAYLIANMNALEKENS
jgi:succinyl-diaminopimelate desuccinylase